jgi:hypothetical protein
MKALKPIMAALATTLLIWALFAAPLFRYATRGVAHTYQREHGGARVMAAGDHLQLMYHFWLLADSLWGETPWFRNPYEFNTGAQNEDLAVSGAYYAPFGPMFALTFPWLGHAGAWNITGFISFWIGWLAMFLLLRRYVKNSWIAALSAGLSIALPYRWITFLGGSPTGFAMMWPPVIMLGIDIAARDRLRRGAWLAGFALMASKWSDTHVFFFSFLATPFWIWISLWQAWIDQATQWPSPRAAFRHIVKSAAALWPMAACMGLAALSTLLITRSLEASAMERGRDMHEITLYAPHYSGFFGWNTLSGHSSQVYLGLAATAVLAIGFVFAVADVRGKKPKAWLRLLLFGSLLAAIAAIAVMALGTRVPGDRHFLVLRGLRKLIPPYRMIRQTAKIYSILPPLLSLAFGLALARLVRNIRRPVVLNACIALVALLALGDYARRISPSVCLLDTEQQAYAAIVADARVQGRDNRAMALPLWPGDTHFSSLYEHYASLYRIRMINGYSPVVPKAYIADVFERFSPMNTGYVDDERLDNLLSRRIGYLLLHEDAFPEKVGPFPVKYTWQALIDHPRIRFLARDRSVWAFRILDEPEPTPPPSNAPPRHAWFPTRFWEAERFAPEGAIIEQAPGTVSRDRYLTLPVSGAAFETPPQPAGHTDGLRYVVRARGSGSFRAVVVNAAVPDPVVQTLPASPDWDWFDIAVPAFQGYEPIRLKIEARDAAVDMDVVLLAAGPQFRPVIGETVHWPADAFFRAGYSIPETGEVVLERDRAHGEPFYGPNLPLPTGTYDLELIFSTEAPAGVELGRLILRNPPGQNGFNQPVLAGRPCRVRYRHEHALVFGLQLLFSRRADMTVEAVTLTRIR